MSFTTHKISDVLQHFGTVYQFSFNTSLYNGLYGGLGLDS